MGVINSFLETGDSDSSGNKWVGSNPPEISGGSNSPYRDKTSGVKRPRVPPIASPL